MVSSSGYSVVDQINEKLEGFGAVVVDAEIMILSSWLQSVAA